MSRIFSSYVNKAKGILDGNWTGSSTKPAPSLYPHQLSRRLKGLITGDIILNNGDEMPDIDPVKLSGELMQTIRRLRDRFYDTSRGLVDYDRLKVSPEFEQYRFEGKRGLHEDRSDALKVAMMIETQAMDL
jgi:hypothetical protein